MKRLAEAATLAGLVFLAHLAPSVPRHLRKVIEAMDPAVSQDEFAVTDPLWTEEVDALAAERECEWDADVNAWWGEMAGGER